MKKNKLFYLLPALLLLVTFMSSSVAFADKNEDKENKGKMLGIMSSLSVRMDSHKKEAKLDDSSLEVSIKDNGQVLVRGAKVSAVSGNVISATTAWGAMNLNWNINVLSSTNIVRKFGSVSPLSEIKVGDIVSFTGTITSGTNNAIVVDAKVVKNWSVTKQNVRSKIEGTIKSVAGAAVPTSMVVTSSGKDYVVSISSATSLVNNAWVNTPMTSLVVGNKVTAYGIVNDTTLTVSASVIRNESI